jgi:ATP-dependent Clp protease protease subunit
MPIHKKSQKSKSKKKVQKKTRKKRERVGILVCGELGDDTIKSAWEAYDDDKEFLLTVCSPGGDITVYHALLDFYETAREEGRLTTLAMGECLSGAPLLVAGGSPGKRFSYKSTLFGLHEPFLASIPPDPAAQYTILQHLEFVKDHFYAFMATFTKHRQAWWRDKLEGQSMYYITALEAKKMGIIDEVL